MRGVFLIPLNPILQGEIGPRRVCSLVSWSKDIASRPITHGSRGLASVAVCPLKKRVWRRQRTWMKWETMLMRRAAEHEVRRDRDLAMAHSPSSWAANERYHMHVTWRTNSNDEERGSRSAVELQSQWGSKSETQTHPHGQDSNSPYQFK